MSATGGRPGQQLHQVREELELYSRKCVELDSELQAARLVGEQSRLEIQALRMQLQHMQRELAKDHEAPPRPRSFVRRLASRLLPARFRRKHGYALGGNACDTEARVASIRDSGWFDGEWYLSVYPDVREAAADPAEHYHEFGWKEGRDPGPRFSTRQYLLRNPDVAAAGVDPLWHYIEYGRAEGR